MPLNRRLADLEKNLRLWYETLGSMEQDFARTYDSRAKIAIQQQIRDEIQPQIRKYETEYWQLLVQESDSFIIEDSDADNAIVEIIQTVDKFKQHIDNSYPDDAIQLLIEIRDKLNQPGKPAAAKLKAALPLLPLFVSYEVEVDTESLLRKVFPTFSRIFKKKVVS